MRKDSGDIALRAGRSVALQESGGNITGNAHCRFTVQGSKKQYRAAAKIGSAGSDLAAVPAE